MALTDEERAVLIAERAAQGLGPKITDPLFYERVAPLFQDGTATPCAVVSSAPTPQSAARRPKPSPAKARAATARTPKKKPLADVAASMASGSN